MKTYKILILLPMFFLLSCKEYTVKTKVNEDGSIIKTVEVVSRNEINNLQNLLIPLDETWSIKQLKDTSNGTYKLTAEKKFKDVSELIKQYGSPGGIIIEVNHSIRGRWFYTYHEYEEIIESANPFTRIDVEDFLNKDEYTSLLNGEVDENLKARLDDYFSAAMMEEFVYLLRERLSEFNINLELIDEIKESFSDCMDVDDEMVCIVHKISDKYPHLELQVLTELTEKVRKLVEGKAEKVFEMNGDYKYVFDMPGIILSTNANAVEGSSVSWKFSGENFAYVNYRMFAESRVANINYMIATGVFAAVLISLLIISMIYKNKK